MDLFYILFDQNIPKFQLPKGFFCNQKFPTNTSAHPKYFLDFAPTNYPFQFSIS